MKSFNGGMLVIIVGLVGILVSGCVTTAEHNAVKSRSEQQAMLIEQYKEENRKLGIEVDSLRARLAEKDKLVGAMEGRELLLRQNIEDMSANSAELFARLEQLGQLGGVVVTQTPEGVKLEVAASVLFDSGKADLKSAGAETLKQVAAVLKASNELIRIDGHTDADPIKYSPFRSNWELSGARALTVLESLISEGIPAQRVAFSAFGPYKPVADNKTTQGKAKNRRVELLVMAGTSAPETDIPPEAGAIRPARVEKAPAPAPAPVATPAPTTAPAPAASPVPLTPAATAAPGD